MQSRRKWAREIADEGFDRIVEGEEEVGWRMVDQARKIDSKTVDELTDYRAWADGPSDQEETMLELARRRVASELMRIAFLRSRKITGRAALVMLALAAGIAAVDGLGAPRTAEAHAIPGIDARVIAVNIPARPPWRRSARSSTAEL
jgi:hypothetical protein